ncbi:MAG: FIST N-terminal domain-containing protein [Elusimicrobiota bacterium]|nr:FIST N-terminal domain-containing protein [Elusimicrobiota bacterium]
MRIGIGLGHGPDGERAAAEAARQALKGAPRPDVAVAFGSIRLDQRRVHRVLSAEFDAKRLIGGSSYAEVTNAGVSKGTVAALALQWGGPQPRVATAPIGAPRRTAKALVAALSPAPGAGRPLGLYFGSVSSGRDNETLDGLRAGLGPVPVFGGMTCGDYDLGMKHPEFWTNFQYGPRLTRDAARAALVSFPDGTRGAFAYEHGWDPVGTPFVITRAKGGRVFEVDGLPVIDYYRRLLGSGHDRAFFELMIQRYGFSVEGDSGRPSFKLPVDIDFSTGSIALYPLEDLQGRRARLILSSRRALLTGARAAAQRCRAGLGGCRPDLVFVVSCCSRGAILHSRLGEELEQVRKVFGRETPVFGFYSGGEIVPFASRWREGGAGLAASGFHTTTLTLMALSFPGRTRVSPLPRRAPGAAAGDLADALARSEATLDRTESIMANLSRKSYEDGEKLRRQSAVIRRYTPHGVWQEVGARAARGQYEVPDAAFTGAFLFMDVKGFTSFSETRRPAEVVRELNALLSPASDAVYARGGDVDKFIGDCIFAVFPDADAALAAARDILALAARRRAQGSPFGVRIGVNWGRAVRANVGSDSRREYTFIGDAVNLAQRMESNAAPDRVLLTAAAWRRLTRRPQGAVRRRVRVKGKAAPVTAWETGA